MKVFVLDGEQRSALAVTRSLGSKGIEVAVGSETVPSLSSCSRYCTDSFRYPSPHKEPDEFINTIVKVTRRADDAVLFPMTDVSLSEILRSREKIDKNILIPFEAYEKYLEASDKGRLFTLARKLRIPIPKTIVSTDYDGKGIPEDALSDLGYPLVIKPIFSRVRTANGIVEASVRYANDKEDLNTILSSDLFRNYPFLVQERINGPGIGIFLLTKDGNPLCRFAHRRIREKPPSGGVSVLCESIRPPEAALNAAETLLRELRWSGVGMAEFKMDKIESVPKLMEVNARFWGSLQLAVTSGVDFPYLLYRMGIGETVEGPAEYKVGIKLRWELGDLDHLFIRLFKKASRLSLPGDHPSRWDVLESFISDTFRSSVINEIRRNDDPKPFVHELKQYIRSILR